MCEQAVNPNIIFFQTKPKKYFPKKIKIKMEYCAFSNENNIMNFYQWMFLSDSWMGEVKYYDRKKNIRNPIFLK